MVDRKARYERRQKARDRRAGDSRKDRRRNLRRMVFTGAGAFTAVVGVIGVFQIGRAACRERV